MVGRAGLEPATPCVSCRFDSFVEVHNHPFSCQLLSYSFAKVRRSLCQFTGVADGVADIFHYAQTQLHLEPTANRNQVRPLEVL
jgi:hypothetical protein